MKYTPKKPSKQKVSVSSPKSEPLKPVANPSKFRKKLIAILSVLDWCLNKVLSFLVVLSKFAFRFAKGSRIIVVIVAAVIVLIFMITTFIDFSRIKAISGFRPSETTKIYDKNDILIAELFQEKRETVSFDKIPDDLKHAIISIEDSEFYDHFGINIKGIVRAFFVNLAAGSVRQGGSTITQQLSKVMLTTGERKLYRKIKEAFIAIMMEMSFSKDEIFNMYLNQIFFGHGTYGVEAASKFYFNKHVWELNTAECALLATLPPAPNRFSPLRHPQRSMRRHRVVLSKMVELGYLEVEQAEKVYLDFWPDYLVAINEISPTQTSWSARVNHAPWFTEFIRRRLISQYGEEMVYNQGLQVYTTLDLKKQKHAEEVLGKALERQTEVSGRMMFRNADALIENYEPVVKMFSDLFGLNEFRRKGSHEVNRINTEIRANIIEELETINFFCGIAPIADLADSFRATFFEDREQQRVEGCIISIDHRTGYIEAMVGGSDLSSFNQLNRTMQSRRQAGSAIKPLLYAAGIETGKITAGTAMLDAPIVYLDMDGGDWLPENYDSDYAGLIRLRKALNLSLNVISVKIAEEVGISTAMSHYARLLKFNESEANRRIQRNFSIALGSTEVSPFELTRAYAIIANGGKEVIPFSIRYIKDRDGEIIENKEDEIKETLKLKTQNRTIQVIKPTTAQLMISLLRGAITNGTGKSAAINRPVAGKTGTTNNFKDAWFVGFTPELTTGVWIGYDKMGLSLGQGQAGGALAAPLFASYMRAALKDEPVRNFPAFAGLSTRRICEKTGMIPTSGCRESIEEIFVPGSEPKDECELCSGGDVGVRGASKAPKDNVTREHSDSAIRGIRDDKSKQEKSKLLDDVSRDLLGD